MSRLSTLGPLFSTKKNIVRVKFTKLPIRVDLPIDDVVGEWMPAGHDVPLGFNSVMLQFVAA